MDNIKFLKVFFEMPNKWHHIRGYARANNISPSTAFKYLNEFYKKNLIEKKKEHNLVLYKANDSSEDFRDMKIFWNIKMIKDSKLLDYLEEKLSPKCIILFGSIAKGTDHKDSDIDLFIMSSVKKEINLGRYESILGRHIQFFSSDENQLKKQKELGNNILNGIILRGYIEIL